MKEQQNMWVSDLNQQEAVLGDNHFPERLEFYDTTLRDGEQTIGVSWNKEEKLEIARMVDSLGVGRIEAGMPVVSKEDKEAVELILNAGLKAEIWGFCRAVKGDVDACIDVGVKHIICEIATSPVKMKANGFTEDVILGKVLDCLQHAKKHGLYTAFFAVDATRADMRFLEKIYQQAVREGGADEVVIVDTLGVATPETMYYLTRQLRQWVDVPIMTHCHNDFGMATACTMFSLKGGAYCAQVTLNGLGEKTGNADIAEAAIAAKLYGMDVNIDMKKLYEAAKLVEKLTRIPISPLKPVVGENVFKKESGVTVAQLIKYPPSVEGYSPEILGREREILLSKKSGKKSVEYKLEQMNIQATSEQADEILLRVKELGLKKKGNVFDDEFKEIARKVMKG
ncbi:MAG: homoaconitate hydratase [Desulfobacteraceae bacterium]|nr:MAG: homoaconitate hydratase [Desulfobacteraceae bacterium]